MQASHEGGQERKLFQNKVQMEGSRFLINTDKNVPICEPIHHLRFETWAFTEPFEVVKTHLVFLWEHIIMLRKRDN